ncbi:DUF3298 domain-containing protein [Dysgonomonas sp. 216]|uniref:DUF3298 domain-containing protein n=1 Tax=Dysgonomonas sp. 216 TaxID=2302934 RepID=UPI0013CF7BE2|nr:DUF3298 domain-containing protein [Dysgonomonas sp. 216]
MTVDNVISFDTINVSRSFHLENDTAQPSCNLEISYIYPVSCFDEAKLDTLQQIFLGLFLDKNYEGLMPDEAFDAYAKNYIDNYKEDARIFYKEKVYEISEDASVDTYFSYYESLSNKILFNKSDLLSLQTIQTNSKGGQNSYKQVYSYVLNLETGELLSEDDIFQPGYERVLNLIFKDRLMNKNGVKTIHDLEDLGYFGIDEMMPNGNFYIDDKAVTYVFNKNEYSVLQLDEIVIPISYIDITDILKKKSPISVFFEE